MGPTAIEVKGPGRDFKIAREDFTMMQAPLALQQGDGETIAKCYSAAVTSDHVVLIPLDISAISDHMIFNGLGENYPLLFGASDVMIYNTQGFLMQLLTTPNAAGIYAIDDPGNPDSMELTYDRHEFNTYREQHAHTGGYGLDPSDHRLAHRRHLSRRPQPPRARDQRHRREPGPAARRQDPELRLQRRDRARRHQRRHADRPHDPLEHRVRRDRPAAASARPPASRPPRAVTLAESDHVMPPKSDTPGVSNAWRPTPPRVYRTALVAAAGAAVAVTMMVGLTTRAWVGQSFPGFFVLLEPHHSVDRPRGLAGDQRRNDLSTHRDRHGRQGRHGNVDAYEDVAAQPPGTAVHYTLRSGASTEILTISSRRFSLSDYWMIFGSYLATGLLYLLVGMLAAWLLPDANLGRALLLLGGAGGIFALTGAGIYQPGADLRIHALAESFFPATLVYLAVVFASHRAPRDVGGRPDRVVALAGTRRHLPTGTVPARRLYAGAQRLRGVPRTGRPRASA